MNIVKLTNSVSMRRCWQGVHRCMVGSRVVVPVLIIHVGIVVVRLVRWWWCARCQYTETRYIYITRYMLDRESLNKKDSKYKNIQTMNSRMPQKMLSIIGIKSCLCLTNEMKILSHFIKLLFTFTLT